MVKDLLKQLQGQDSGQWANNRVSGLDRTLGEISRILEKQVGTTVNGVIELHRCWMIFYSVNNKKLNVYGIGSNSKILVLHAIGIIQLLHILMFK